MHSLLERHCPRAADYLTEIFEVVLVLDTKNDEQFAQSKKQDRQRRLIDISEIEMPPGNDVIKLIAKIAVTPVGQQMDEQGYSAKKGD